MKHALIQKLSAIFGTDFEVMPDKKSHVFGSVEENIHSLMAEVESVQYEAAIIVSGTWKGTSRTKLYADLVWESFYHHRSLR